MNTYNIIEDNNEISVLPSNLQFLGGKIVAGNVPEHEIAKRLETICLGSSRVVCYKKTASQLEMYTTVQLDVDSAQLLNEAGWEYADSSVTRQRPFGLQGWNQNRDFDKRAGWYYYSKFVKVFLFIVFVFVNAAANVATAQAVVTEQPYNWLTVEADTSGTLCANAAPPAVRVVKWVRKLTAKDDSGIVVYVCNDAEYSSIVVQKGKLVGTKAANRNENIFSLTSYFE